MCFALIVQHTKEFLADNLALISDASFSRRLKLRFDRDQIPFHFSKNKETPVTH